MIFISPRHVTGEVDLLHPNLYLVGLLIYHNAYAKINLVLLAVTLYLQATVNPSRS